MFDELSVFKKIHIPKELRDTKSWISDKEIEELFFYKEPVESDLFASVNLNDKMQDILLAETKYKESSIGKRAAWFNPKLSWEVAA